MNKTSKKEVIKNNKAFAYYSGCGGIEIHFIEYSINDAIYYTAGAWNGRISYHKAIIKYDKNGEAYFLYHGYKINLNECIKM